MRSGMKKAGVKLTKRIKNRARCKWLHCRYCGARLRRDHIGQYCSTRNCQWQHGLPKDDDTPTYLER